MLKWLQGLIAAKTDRPPPRPTASPEARPDVAIASVSTAISPVVRQLVLGRDHQVVGYDFALRAPTMRSQLDARSQQTSDESLIRTIQNLGADRIAQFRQLWLTLNECSLSNPLLGALPGKATVILIRPPAHGTVDASLLETARGLQQKGFRLALLGQPFTPTGLAWLPIVDYVGLDIDAYAPKELGDTVSDLHGRRSELGIIARRIDSYEEFEYCRAAGFDMFSGHFLTHREVWPPQPPLHPDRVRLCNALNQLRSGGELNEVADSLRISPELSYRFLRYVNSAGMGLPSHIGSIEQGVMYLGREKLYRWLTLLMFSSSAGRSTDSALLEQALVRGRMMELLGSEKLSRIQCDELFVIGVFSLLDVLLRLPMDIALGPLQLPQAAGQALREGSGPYAAYLKLAIAAETNDIVETNAAGGGHEEQPMVRLAETIGVGIEAVNAQHLHAVAWAQQLNSTPSES
jgi:c-di-GMP phosphodiesterase